jgi:RNA polymerase sigma factor (sigma-70 family)
MNFDDVRTRLTEKLNDEEKKVPFPNHQQSVYSASLKNLPSFKKIRLLPLAAELPAISLPTIAVFPAPLPVPNIKPPPTIFPDLWGERETSSSGHAEILQTGPLDLDQIIGGHQDAHVFENTLAAPEGKSTIPILPEQESMLDGLWKNAPEETNEDWARQVTTSFDDPNLFDDLDLFDIDVALAKQEAEVQQQEYEQRREVANRKSRFERWGGVSSLIYVNWDNPEIAEQDALARLGYANIPLSQETRTFIIQAARNARLPHRQEIQLTTQLVHARAQLASLPPYDEEDAIDPYASRRQALRAEITEIEQTLTCKMQWVAIKKAVQFLGQGVELEDLIQFGMLGVIAGIQHFDITRNARLLLAVNSWTFQALIRAIADYGSPIRLPAHIFEQVRTLKKQHSHWQREHGRLPTHQNIAEIMGISQQSLKMIVHFMEVMNASKQARSIESLASAEYLNEGYSFQEAESNLLALDDISTDILGEISGQQMQQKLFQGLTSKQIQVFSQRAGLDEDGEEHTLEEIGQQLGVTRERVRQIEEKVREKIICQLQKMSPESSAPQKNGVWKH